MLSAPSVGTRVPVSRDWSWFPVSWLRKYSDFFFQPTREDIKAIPKQTQITIDNQLKTALVYLEMDFGVNGALVPLFVHSSLLFLFQKEYFG